MQALALFLILGGMALCANPAEAGGSSNPAYQEWMQSYEGQFERLKYTDIAYRGNRRANSGKERLAPFSDDREKNGITGNYFFQAGPEQTLGLNQKLAVLETAPGALSTQGARFKPGGFHVQLSKRLFQISGVQSHLNFSYRQSSAELESFSGGTLRTPTGERVDLLTGAQENFFFNLDWSLRKNLAQKQRYSAQLLGGIRFSDMAIKVNTTGNRTNPVPAEENLVSTAQDYHFRNLGIGPFVGFRAETPITNKVRTGITLKQVFLPSKGKSRFSRFNQNAAGATLVNETSEERRFTTFPITEVAWDLNFHFDRSKKLYLGYSYSHWNLYEIKGFGSDNFRDLTMHGPRGALQFLF